MADIDPRLTKEIANILETIDGTVEVFDGVDIAHVDLYSNKDGGSTKFFQIVSSDDSTKITRKDPNGDIVDDDFIVIGGYPTNMIPETPMNPTQGDIRKTENFINALKQQLTAFGSGADNQDDRADITKKWLTRVRKYMNVMDEVFGFNTPEQLEVFIAAWCSADSTTRLTGIPGTGKTTLIECASMMFSNSYGFDEAGAPVGQTWDSDKLRNREVREAWDSTRFDEGSYKYPFTFLSNKTPSGETLDSIHEATKGMVARRPEYGVCGSLDPKEFDSMVKALKNAKKLLLVNGGGVPVHAERDSKDEETTYTEFTGRKIKDGITGEERDEVRYFYAVPIASLQAKSRQCSSAYAKVQKDSDGRPNAGAGTSAEELADAIWFYEYGSIVNQMMVDATKLSARDFVGKWFYDQRRNRKDGKRSIDNEMRREIGTAKIDKDKRAEQVLYGVEIQSKEITGGSQYVFEPYPRPIVTQPVKFFNEINRSQPGVEDAILGLIAEKEVEYRGEVFNSPNFVNWMDNNPHVGGNDLAFTDRIDIELLFPSALLDQRYKVLKAKNDRGERGAGGTVMKPRQRVLQAILDGQVTPMRFTELKEGVWNAVNTVKFSAPGYNALMDIAIVSMLFSQRFGTHPAVAGVAGEGMPNGFNHERMSGEYQNSIKPLTASGWFVDASVTENISYRTNIGQSTASLANGHGAMVLLNRVLAFRFTNSLAKFARSLAWLRGNEYVTRKEVMDMLPYVVGHRIGRARGENNKVVFGLDDEAANSFQSGQEFVREAIVEGYIRRNIDSFLNTTGGSGTDSKQSRWIEWDSTIAQARRELATSPTYAEYEKKMWGMARLGAFGDGNDNATGDPYPYLIYRLVLMEELTASGETCIHPFKTIVTKIEDGREVKDTVLLPYSERVKYYQNEVMSFLTMKQTYSANDIGVIRKKISIERWLTIDDKRALLTQLDSVLDGMTGLQIPDDFDGTKYWGMYSTCVTESTVPKGYPVGIPDSSKLGFPLRDFIRTFTWYGGSSTGRTVYYLYRGQSDLLDDSYPDIKGQGSPLTDGATNATMPLASKLNAQQSATIQASVSSAEEAQNLKNRFNNFLSDLNNGNEFTLIDGTAVNCEEVVADGTPNEMSVDEMKTKVTDFIDKIQTSNTPLKFNSDNGQIHLCVELNHQISEYSEQIMSAEEDRLRLWISVYGAVGGPSNARKVATINLCLSSAFVKLNNEGKPEVVSTTDTEPFGESGGLAISDIAQTYRNGNFTFFDAGNMTSKDVQTYNRILKRHYIG